MSEQDKINKFAEDCRKDLDKANIKEGEYCVLILAGNASRPRFIYKDIESFKQKAVEDAATIDSMFSVDMQLWIFD